MQLGAWDSTHVRMAIAEELVEDVAEFPAEHGIA